MMQTPPTVPPSPEFAQERTAQLIKAVADAYAFPLAMAEQAINLCLDPRPCPPSSCTLALRAARDAIEAVPERSGLDQMRLAIDVMNRFCDRVERGEVRSRRTYAEFCEILGRVPE